MKTISLKTGQTVKIRRADKEDAAAMIDYICQIVTETDFLTIGPGDFTISLGEEENFIASFIEAKNSIFLVAEIDGRLVGAAHFDGGKHPRLRHTGEMGITVVKEYWGIGIGKALMDCVINWAKECGVIKKINLLVHQDNYKASNLYKKFGFQKEGIRTREFCIQGKLFDATLMGLTID